MKIIKLKQGSPEWLEGQRLGESAMSAALGPVAGIGINVLKGVQEMSEGRYARGLEAMVLISTQK